VGLVVVGWWSCGSVRSAVFFVVRIVGRKLVLVMLGTVSKVGTMVLWHIKCHRSCTGGEEFRTLGRCGDGALDD